ncbi:MAG: S41 family peptidase [Vicinamibacteraceae bacterium]
MNAIADQLDPSIARDVIERSVGLLERHCIRLNGRDPHWPALFAEGLEDIAQAGSPLEFEKRVNAVILRGGLSHVAFFHEGAQRAPARYAINATFCPVETEQGSRWMFQDVHEGGPAHAAGMRPGDVLLAVNGTQTRPPEPPTFALGTDADVTVESTGDGARQVTVVLPKPEPGKPNAKPPMAEPTSVVAREVEPGIAYAKIAFFPGVNGQRFARELDGAIACVGNCTRLIIDLRGNLGGFVGSLRLMSYLTPDRVPVGYSLTRKGEDRKWRPDQLPCIDRLPATTFEMLTMAVRFKVLNRDRSIRLKTEGLGPKPFHGRIVMLVNEHTVSAGEMVAAFAKENRLARIVGTRTGGQVLGGANFPVGHGFVLRFPAAGWYSWSRRIIEGCGVAPDVDVPLSVDGLRQGGDNQFDAALREVQGT